MVKELLKKVLTRLMSQPDRFNHWREKRARIERRKEAKKFERWARDVEEEARLNGEL